MKAKENAWHVFSLAFLDASCNNAELIFFDVLWSTVYLQHAIPIFRLVQ